MLLIDCESKTPEVHATTAEIPEVIIDSACTKHSFTDSRLFESFEQAHNRIIRVGNNEEIKVLGIGNVRIGRCNISNALCVPGLTKNLLSVPQLMRKGFRVEFFGLKCTATDPHGNIVLTGTLQDNNLITLDPSCQSNENDVDLSLLADAQIKDKADLMHRRWGHVNSKLLSIMDRQNHVTGFEFHKTYLRPSL